MELKYEETLELMREKSKRYSYQIFVDDIDQTWAHFKIPSTLLPQSGFKIHISLSLKNLHSLISNILPILFENQLEFKICKDIDTFIKLNSGLLGGSQIGKNITIYTITREKTLTVFHLLRPFCQDNHAPKISSDLYYEASDSISIRFGQIGSSTVTFDACGRSSHFIATEAGDLTKDDRTPEMQKGSLERPLIYNGKKLTPILKHLKIGDVVKFDNKKFEIMKSFGRDGKQVHLIKNLDSHGLFIMKCILKNSGESFRESNFKKLMDKEIFILNYIEDLKIAPRPYLYYEDNFFHYLILEDIPGDSLDKLSILFNQETLLKCLALIEKLHLKASVVHRDLKLKNFVLDTRNREFKIIDFETAGIEGQKMSEVNGTNNYKPLEVDFDQTYLSSMDIYSCGALIFHLVLGKDPSYFYIQKEKIPLLLKTNGYSLAAHIVTSCFDDNPINRPTIKELQKFIINHDIFKRDQTIYQGEDFLRQDIEQSVKSAYQGCKKFIIKKDEHTIFWRNKHLESQIHAQGINIGSAGIIIGLNSYYQRYQEEETRNLIIQTANGLMATPPFELAHGFFTGNAGVAYALALASQYKSPFKNESLKRFQLAADSCLENDLFFGKAGLIYGAYKMAKVLDSTIPIEICHSSGLWLKENVCDIDGIYGWQPTGTLENEVIPSFGVSHGIAGQAMALYLWSEFFNDLEGKEISIEAFKRIFIHGKSQTGQYLRYNIHPLSQAKGNIEWCHGFAGVIWAILQCQDLYLKFADEIKFSANLFFNTPVISNPTLCHGLSGQLELCQMLIEKGLFVEDSFDLAYRILKVLSLIQQPFGKEKILMWPSEDPDTITPDFWVGNMGCIASILNFSRNQLHTRPINQFSQERFQSLQLV